MKLINNTMLITGGATGIGRALAEALQAAGNEVIIAGRRLALLDAVRAANPGMKSAALDITDPESIKALAEKMRREFPRLNVVIQNAGIMRMEALPSGSGADADSGLTLADTWRALEDLVDGGWCKAIGLSDSRNREGNYWRAFI